MKAIVFGGTSGIGLRTAEVLSAMGWEVCIPDTDVTELGGIRQAIREANKDEPITKAVYSVGINNLHWLSSVEPAMFLHMLHVNVVGFAEMMKELMRIEHLRRPMSVVAVSSDAAFRPMRTSLMYCASKAALTMAVRVASRELADRGWRVNSVSPGKVEGTPMTKYVDSRVLQVRGWTKEKAEAYERSSSPIGRPVSVDEVVGVIIDTLLSPVLAFTGQDIVVNGGR